MKKLIVGFILCLTLLFGSAIESSAICIVRQVRISPVIVLAYIDINCDGFIDIVQKLWWNGYTWVEVGRRPY